MTQEKKSASPGWIAFALAITSSLFTGLVLFVLLWIVGMIFPNVPYETIMASPFGLLAFSLLTYVVLWFCTASQAKFVRERYLIASYPTIVIYAVIAFVVLDVLTFGIGWWQGYVWGWQDYVGSLVSLAVFYFSAKRHVHA